MSYEALLTWIPSDFTSPHPLPHLPHPTPDTPAIVLFCQHGSEPLHLLCLCLKHSLSSLQSWFLPKTPESSNPLLTPQRVRWLFFFGHVHLWKFPGQGSNLCHSSDLSCYSDNTRSWTHCITRELLVNQLSLSSFLPPSLPSVFQLEPLPWQHWILNLLCHKETPADFFYQNLP